MMKITYDKAADAAYIYLKYPLKDGECATTKELDEHIILDFDASGKIVGVEILNASKVLSRKVISEAVAL